MAFEKKLFLLSGATQSLATAMAIEIIHCQVVLTTKKGMLTVEVFQDWTSKKEYRPTSYMQQQEIPDSVLPVTIQKKSVNNQLIYCDFK